MPGVTEFRSNKDKDSASDLDEIAREGARRMLAQALEAEVADYIARHQERDESGRAQVVRNGKARPRKVTLGSGTIEDRRAAWSHGRPTGRWKSRITLSRCATILFCQSRPVTCGEDLHI